MKLTIKTNLKSRYLGSPRISRNGKVVVAGACIHDTAGTGLHNDTLYLANPGEPSDPRTRKVSVDFTVERDGSVYQLNPDLVRNYTFHAGRATKFKAADGRTYLNRDVTRVLIGIELCQKARMDLTPAWPTEQIQAVAELCVFLCQTFGFGKDQITTHARVITDNSRTDPRAFPWTVFWFHFNKAANPSALDLDPDNGGLGSPVNHSVAAGDTLWSLAKRYSTSIESIKALNDINDPSNVLRIGQILKIRK